MAAEHEIPPQNGLSSAAEKVKKEGQNGESDSKRFAGRSFRNFDLAEDCCRVTVSDSEDKKEGIEIESGDRRTRSPMDEEAEGCGVIQPHSQLPRPEPPQGLKEEVSVDWSAGRSKSLSETLSVDLGKFIRERKDAIMSRLSSMNGDPKADSDSAARWGVTEFSIKELKVVVKLPSELDLCDGLRGRIAFFSRSNCRDCTAVRSFFRERGLRFVEINVDVFPSREKELVRRTGTSQVPQIFFNDKLFGGLVALNSLRNSGEFDKRVKEMLSQKCSGDTPAPPVYGFDSEEEEEEERRDELAGIARVLRQKLPIQDRLVRLKLLKNCFSGSEMVEVLINHLDCGRKKAVEIGKQLAEKHFIHHVFGENDFEDGSHYYRLLEHEPFIPKCYNFRGPTNDVVAKPASKIAHRLYKLMSAILESYASDDRRSVDYVGISRSEEFRRYLNLAQDLQRMNLHALSSDERLAFFLNLYNGMVIHAVIRLWRPKGMVDQSSFFSDFQYVIGGYSYSLGTIRSGILRNNRRPPYALTRPFGNGDKRLELALPKVNPLIHFGLCDGTKSSPTVRFFSPESVEAQLRHSAREFFRVGGIEVALDRRVVYLTRIIKWYTADFGSEKEVLRWVVKFLDANKAGLVMHLLSDGAPVNVVYQDYDWSTNS